MSSTSETILSQQTHPGDSVEETVTGDKFKGDGYYGRSDGLHTIQVDLEGFVGTIEIQGTLEIDPGSTDWFSVELESSGTSTIGFVDTTGAITTRSPTISSITYTDSQTSVNNYNFTGNYVWVRAHISNWTDGTVNSVLLNH